MVRKILILFSLFLFVHQYVEAQKGEARFSIGLEGQLLIASEFNASFEFLSGLRGKYLLKDKGMFTPLWSVGLTTDLANSDAQMISFDIQAGTFWRYRKRFSLSATLGGHYLYESHKFQLIEKTANWRNVTLGLTGSFGINYRISNSISSTLSFTQTNLSYRSIGLGLNYSF